MFVAVGVQVALTFTGDPISVHLCGLFTGLGSVSRIIYLLQGAWYQGQELNGSKCGSSVWRPRATEFLWMQTFNLLFSFGHRHLTSALGVHSVQEPVSAFPWCELQSSHGAERLMA